MNLIGNIGLGNDHTSIDSSCAQLEKTIQKSFFLAGCHFDPWLGLPTETSLQRLLTILSFFEN